MKKTLCISVLFILISFQTYSQGKIISKESANELFGPVLISKEIPTENLQMIIDKSKEVVMFKIINNEVYILNNNRDVLIPLETTIDSSEVFSVYAISVLQELLNKDSKMNTFIESWKEVLTITNGDKTIEFSDSCPPYCN